MKKIMRAEPQVSRIETDKIIEICHGCLALDGDVVELGCYEGDTSLELAKIVQKPKKLWIYDSFEGLPEKTAADNSAIGADFRAGELFVTKREVKSRFLRAGLTVPVIKKAWFEDLTDTDLPEKICFAFLDGDLYESIRVSLELVCDKMTDSGVIAVHDYTNPALPGVAKAVDEWLREHSKKVEIFQSLALIFI